MKSDPDTPVIVLKEDDGAPQNAGLVEFILDDAGNPPCSPAEGCLTCFLYLPLTPERLSRMRALANAGRETTPIERKEPVVRSKRWSQKYDRCIAEDCCTPDSIHGARGLCAACYLRRYHVQRKGKKEDKEI